MPSREFPGTVEAAADAEAWLASESGALGLAGETAFAIHLCVEELFLNAVKHGRANKTTISIWTEPDGTRLEFIDDGRAFDPTVAPAKRLSGPGTDFEIGGFGTGLVQKFSRRMTYHRADGANRLVLEFDAGPDKNPELKGISRRMIDLSALRLNIRATSAFRQITEDDVSYLIEVGELKTYEQDAVLMIQGEESHDAAVILAGQVTVIADSVRGAIPIAILDAPCLVGELGALAHLQRSATVRARTPVTALRVGRSALAEVARTTPSLLIDVIGRMGDRLRRFNGAIGLYTHALEALERHEFDPALLDELRNPLPDLADFGHTFGRMAEQILLRRQRSDEMASAAVIQRALLPKPEEFAAETGVDACATMNAARDVGGDWFELVALDDGRVAVGVGDVCGKGVPAALFTGITKTLIRINLRERPDLPGAILKANAYLANNNAAELFATLLYAAFDLRTGDVEIVSCGHLPALMRRADGRVEKLSGGGLPVGLFEALKPKTLRTEMARGDLLFIYTDGVTEAEDQANAEFGEERLSELLATGEPCSAAAWVARVEDAVRAHARGRVQFDDITCVALAR